MLSGCLICTYFQYTLCYTEFDGYNLLPDVTRHISAVSIYLPLTLRMPASNFSWFITPALWYGIFIWKCKSDYYKAFFLLTYTPLTGNPWLLDKSKAPWISWLPLGYSSPSEFQVYWTTIIFHASAWLSTLTCIPTETSFPSFCCWQCLVLPEGLPFPCPLLCVCFQCAMHTVPQHKLVTQ